MNYNKVILGGNLTRDPELRYTPKGAAIAKFGLAVNRKWKSESGESKEEVLFIDVDCFGKQAETVGQYFKKGRTVLVEGRLKLDQWDDKQTGQKRSRIGVVLESFQFVGGGEKGEQKEAAQKPKIAKEDVPGAVTKPEAAADDGGDDMPF